MLLTERPAAQSIANAYMELADEVYPLKKENAVLREIRARLWRKLAAYERRYGYFHAPTAGLSEAYWRSLFADEARQTG